MKCSIFQHVIKWSRQAAKQTSSELCHS